MDFDFSNIEISIISADSRITDIENTKEIKQLPLQIKEAAINEKSYIEMQEDEISESIIILQYDFKSNLKYLKLMNISDEDINKIQIKLVNSSGKEKIITIGGLKSNSEKKFMSVDLSDLLIDNNQITSINVHKAFK